MNAGRAWALFAVVWQLCGCAAHKPASSPEPKLTPPGTICNDSALGAKSFCVPEGAEAMLKTGTFDIVQVAKPKSGLGGSRIVFLHYPHDHDVMIKSKWKTAPKGGDGFNNDPRRELAAYKVQTLFLDPKDYVVPPTVGRCIPTATFRKEVKVKGPDETFEGIPCVYGLLAYWLINVTSDGVFDLARFESDPEYRRSVANMNLLTYLIDHRDTRKSNFLISTDREHPRTFSIDNGLAFSGFRNPLAYFTKINWAKIIVPELPRDSLKRLAKLNRQDLDTLLTASQYSATATGMTEVPPTAPLPGKGVRREGDVIQLGLTRAEVDGIEKRLKSLLEKVDRGEIKTF